MIGKVEKRNCCVIHLLGRALIWTGRPVERNPFDLLPAFDLSADFRESYTYTSALNVYCMYRYCVVWGDLGRCSSPEVRSLA